MAAAFGAALHRVLQITLKRSALHHKPNQCATLRALGLKRPHQVVYMPNVPEVRGHLNVVKHLVEIKAMP